MLDNVNVEGLDTLNMTAAWLIGSAIVILVIGVAAGAVVVSSGKAHQNPDRATKGYSTIGISIGAAILLGGIGPAVAWGMERGNESLMPTAARPTEITVERQEPATTCDRETEEFDMGNNSENVQWVRELVGPEHEDEGPLGDSSFWTQQVLTEVTWYPDGTGGDCDPDEEVVAECTDVELHYREQDLLGPSQQSETITISGDDC